MRKYSPNCYSGEVFAILRQFGTPLVYSNEELREGQTAVGLSASFLCANSIITLPKTLHFVEIPYSSISNLDLKKRTYQYTHNTGTTTVILPVGLLYMNKHTEFPYIRARPHILRALYAMRKVCTARKYGKDVGNMIMRAIFETGPGLIEEWKRAAGLPIVPLPKKIKI